MIKPLYDKLAIRPDKAVDKTDSGIFLADSSKVQKFRGLVVAAGPGHRLPLNGEIKPLIVKAGDRVEYSQYGGRPIECVVDDEIGKETLVMVSEDQVWAVLEEE